MPVCIHDDFMNESDYEYRMNACINNHEQWMHQWMKWMNVSLKSCLNESS